MITLISSNYSCLEDIFMVLKVFEPLKFYSLLKPHCLQVHISALMELGKVHLANIKISITAITGIIRDVSRILAGKGSG